MQEHIVQFVQLLRQAGLRVSTAEIVDALVAVERAGLSDKGVFRAALKATLVKRLEEFGDFDTLFDLYFSAFDAPVESLAPVAALGKTAEVLSQVLSEADGAFSASFRKLLLESLPAFSSLLLETGRRVGLAGMRYPLQARHFGQKMRREFGMDLWQDQTEHLLKLLKAKGVSASDLAGLEREIGERIRLLSEMIQNHADRQARALHRADRSRDMRDELLQKAFGALTAHEIQAMRRVVQELAKKIRDEAALRERRARKGRLDIKRTLRKSLAYGGLPLEAVLKKRKRSKGRIVVLCDVSQSVWNASRFMLHLLYSLQDQFSKVRSFVFVDRLGEVTACFERYEVNTAVDKALREAGIPYHRYTDYGSVFREFCERHIEAVNRRTTLIVIGDGRNNFFLPGEEYLERIRARVRRVIWLNPESRGFWKVGDSMMHRYAKHCDEVRECRNLEQLTAFVNDLAL